MKRFLLILATWLLISCAGISQVSVSTDSSAPDSSAMLDVRSTSRGILIPRMSKQQRDLIPNPAEGLVIFQTDEAPGFYYNSGSPSLPVWKSTTNAGTEWLITGNACTNPSSNFLGTTDDTPLAFRVNNKTAGRIDHLLFNTFLGYRTGDANSTGYSNTATGYNALCANTTGFRNTAAGWNVLAVNNTGRDNTAIGVLSLTANTAGSYNTAIGASSLGKNLTGSSNTACGGNALVNNIQGYNNVATGSNALPNNTSGNNNVACGRNSQPENTTGSCNTAIGYSAGRNCITGNNNIAIGDSSGCTGSFNNTVSIGNKGWLNDASNQVFIGNASTQVIGGCTGWSVISDARIKKDVREDVKGLDFVTRLHPVTYRKSIRAICQTTGNKEPADFPEKYNAEKDRYSGFLAQEVEKAAKEAGYDFSGIRIPDDVNQLYSLSYEQFVVPLVKAVQELNEQNIAQQKLIGELQKKIEKLERIKDKNL